MERPAGASVREDETRINLQCCTPLELGHFIARFVTNCPPHVHINYVYNRIISLVADLRRTQRQTAQGDDCEYEDFYWVLFMLSAALVSNWFSRAQESQLEDRVVEVASWLDEWRRQ
eukprot:jgi/Mesvir1/4726/Mv04550-RA.1